MLSADITSRIIIKQLRTSAAAARKRVHVVDGCACIGGNTISFGKHFAKVTAIEVRTS